MKKEFEEDDGLKRFLETEVLQETQEIEKNLFSKKDSDEFEMSDEEVRASYERMVQKLKEKGVYREDPAGGATKAGPMEMSARTDSYTDKVLAFANAPVPRRFSLAKVAGYIVVALIAVFLGSMTSEANRRYFIKQVRYWSGNESRITANNDQMEQSSFEEIDAVQTIEKELGVPVPRFIYQPKGFSFYDYFYYRDGEYALFEYRVDDTSMVLVIEKQTEARSSYATDVHGDETTNISMPEYGFEIYANEVQNIDGETEYTADWIYCDALYQLRARMDWEEFEKLLMGIQY